MVQCIAVIHWYHWVLNNVLNKGLQMCEMWLCVLPHSCCLSCVHVCLPARVCPAYLCLMQMLWTGHMRVPTCVHVPTPGRVRVRSRVPHRGAAALLHRSIRLEKFLLFF